MAINTTTGTTSPTAQTTTPTTTPVAPKPAPISEGTKARAVAHLERSLKAAGYDVGKPDQKFDEKTTRAVKLFQAAWGLPATGALDAATKKKLEQTTDRLKAHKNAVGVGQRGKDVFAAEKRLKKLGYEVKADGVYDTATAAAVKEFKADSKLKNKSGMLGSVAAKQLRQDAAGLDHAAYRRRVTNDLKEHRRLDAATKTAAAKEGGITEGSNERAVKNVQAHLKGAGFDPGTVDGKFDSRTQAMVERFQRKAGLEPTGVVDSKTWEKLSAVTFEAKNGTSPKQRLGENSAAVMRTEKILKKLGYDVKVDGIFDRQTQRASRKFEERIRGTGDNGAIGAHQLKRMKQVLAAKEHPGTGPVLKTGYKGQPVKILQRRLEQLGFDVGAVDGDFGKKTKAAVQRFQRTFGLKADGQVTANDWRMLAVKSKGKVNKPGGVGSFNGSTGSIGKRLASAGYSAAMSIGGYTSQGLCATGVSRAIANAMGITVWGNGNQIDNNLPRSRFKQVNMSLEQALKIPGCILTWEKTSTAAGSIYGHTAITKGDGHTTYSDFIETYTSGSGRYGLKVFVPR